jgi:tetratricopeptide (TPR) repeat protein
MSPAPRPRKPETPRKDWGSVARHGAREVAPEPVVSGARRPRREPPKQGPPPPWEAERWHEEARTAPVRRQATKAVKRGAGRPRTRPPKAVAQELAAAVGERRAPAAARRFGDAVRAFERERYADVTRLLRPLGDQAPGVAAVRELLGLAFYRQGKWADAARHLEAYRAITRAYDEHPVLADSYRALGQWDEVAGLWEDLREASPGAEIVTEGRIVAAGALADQGEVRSAIRLLRKGAEPARPKWFHLRLWYSLADLYERAGEVPRARELFSRILERDASFADVVERLEALE